MKFEEADALNGAIRALCIRHRARAGALLSSLGLHAGHETLLLLLEVHGPQAQKELAEGAHCEPPSITHMVRKLEAAGLVQRQPSPTDKRQQIVELTAQGRELLPKVKDLWTQLANETARDLTTDELASLADTLQTFASNLRAEHG